MTEIRSIKWEQEAKHLVKCISAFNEKVKSKELSDAIQFLCDKYNLTVVTYESKRQP